MRSPEKLTEKLNSPAYLRPFRPVPFWSWNDRLDKNRLLRQIEWMHENGIGGFFMHARGGLLTEYLGREWMECCDACCDKAAALDMDAYMYDENGWPSGFVGGKLLEEEGNRDQSLTFATGDFDADAFVSYKITPTALLRATAREDGARYLNVYRHVSVSTVDVLNPEVTEKFLDLTHRAYKARYGREFSAKLKGFFTDEPQYFRWDTPYTPMITAYFREVYGQDILDGLGLLFAEKEGYEDFRFKYWTGMRTLFLRNFSRKIYDFCEENGMALTGHYVEESTLGMQMMCCAGVMPYYMYEHIPGIDWLGRGLPGELAVKQVGSVAAQTGRNRVLTESFGCCGWDVTPRELKKILDYQYLGGVNLLCHHLLPSSEYGQRKRDYPQHYTPLNPWIAKHFHAFNTYYTRLGALIGHSEEVVNVCVLHPITAAYLDYRRDKEDFGIASLEESFRKETEMLASEHIPHHYVDEVVLAEMGSVEDGCLVCGKCKYRYVVLPSMKTMTETTHALLAEFVAAGGKLLLLGAMPAYLEGKKHTYTDLASCCTLAEIKAAQPYSADNAALRSSMRVCDEGEFIFLINPTEETQHCTLTAGDAKSVRELCLESVTLSEPMPLTRTLRPGQSAILFPCAEKATPVPQKPIVRLAGAQRVVSATCNTLMLDSARVALEGEAFGESQPLIQTFSRLLERRYAGELQLKYAFTAKTVPENIRLYAEDMRTKSVRINGTTVEHVGTLEHEEQVRIYDIAPHVKAGENEIVVTVDYYQDENVYYALFGEGVTESLRNCMVYNTALESVYLVGDFGVYPVNPRRGQTEHTVLCDGFVLDAPARQVRDLTRDGYATFAGSLTLESEIDCPAGGCLLEIGGRWQTAEVEIGGKRRTLLFDNAVDVSDMVREGKNTVRVTLTTSLRNLMGPHHFAPCDEPEAVGPEHFDLCGTWQNGESPWFRASYALVKTEF